jgi:tRNA(fMet)-specific endonuclease VapC
VPYPPCIRRQPVAEDADRALVESGAAAEDVVGYRLLQGAATNLHRVPGAKADDRRFDHLAAGVEHGGPAGIVAAASSGAGNALAEQLCISSITLGELHYGAEKSARRAGNLTAIEHFVARLDVLPFGDKAAVHHGQLRAELERAGTPCGPHDMQIGGHARSEGLILVTNDTREFERMPGLRIENWL